MDNSSRNIVNFIATVTVAALLLMGASFWAQSGNAPVQQDAGQAVENQSIQISAPTPELDEAGETSEPVEGDGFSDSDQNVDLEEPDKITGEPSLKIDSDTETAPIEG